MIQFSVPIYYKDYIPRAKKNKLLGMNWYTGASNVIRGRGGSATTVAAMTKVKFNEMFQTFSDQLKEESPYKFNQYGPYGYEVHVDVYAKRLGTDASHNVGPVILKFALDALEKYGIIDNDKYVYKTSMNGYIDRENPRAEITIKKITEPYEHVIR